MGPCRSESVEGSVSYGLVGHPQGTYNMSQRGRKFQEGIRKMVQWVGNTRFEESQALCGHGQVVVVPGEIFTN